MKDTFVKCYLKFTQYQCFQNYSSYKDIFLQQDVHTSSTKKVHTKAVPKSPATLSSSVYQNADTLAVNSSKSILPS